MIFFWVGKKSGKKRVKAVVAEVCFFNKEMDGGKMMVFFSLDGF